MLRKSVFLRIRKLRVRPGDGVVSSGVAESTLGFCGVSSEADFSGVDSTIGSVADGVVFSSVLVDSNRLDLREGLDGVWSV